MTNDGALVQRFSSRRNGISSHLAGVGIPYNTLSGERYDPGQVC
jgi:hypothetical protein